MNWLRLVRARLLGLCRKRLIDEEINDELAFHLSMRTHDNITAGMSAIEARRSAERALGNVLLIKDACRDVRGGGNLEILLQDVRFAWRMLTRDRAFTAVAVLALALGLGANIALFTVMSNVLLRPLAFREPGQLMSIWTRETDHQKTNRFPLSYPDYLDLASRSRSFEAIGGYFATKFIVRPSNDNATELRAALVTPELFQVLGMDPILGRAFIPSENEPGNRSVIISEQLWQQHFGDRTKLADARLALDGEQYSVVGVMPADFHFPLQNEPTHLWTTFARDREPFPDGNPSVTNRRDAHFVSVIGRLKKNIRSSAAEKELASIATDLANKYPQTNARLESYAVVALLSDLTRMVRPSLLMLAGAAFCVLCIACLNVANLLLARSATREKEIAIRAALGAGRRRIIRQLLTESLLLGIIGGATGLLLAFLGTHYIVSLLPTTFPRLAEISPDSRVLVFTFGMILLTSCFFGFAPAWRLAHCDLASVLNDGSRGPNDTKRGRRARGILVVAEMILSFILLAGACDLIRALWRLEDSAPGFNPQNVFVANLSIPVAPDAESLRRVGHTFQNILAEASRIEGVSSVSAVNPLPFTSLATAADFETEGRPIPKAQLPRARAHIIEPNYFRTMEVPVLSGRDFDSRDQRDSAAVVIINQALAKAHFANENPIGKIIKPGMSDGGSPQAREVIGVVGDMRSVGIAADPQPEVYLPYSQCVSSQMALVIRGRSDLPSLTVALTDMLKGRNDWPQSLTVKPMMAYLTDDMAQPRLSSRLLGAFALGAILLTAIGVYGVTSYSAAQRRHEIGIRLALGAPKSSVFRLVIKDSLRLIAWSLLGGILLTLCLARLGDRSIAIEASESSELIAVIVLLSAVALLASWIPARRAASEDPLLAIGQR